MFTRYLISCTAVMMLVALGAMPALTQEPVEPPPVEAVEPVEPAPIQDAEPAPVEPVTAADGSDSTEPEPVEVVEVVEPAPEPTIGDLFDSLESAITARNANGVTVAAAEQDLVDARDALVDAEDSLALAMQGQGEHVSTVRSAAQALVDRLTAAYLVP